MSDLNDNPNLAEAPTQPAAPTEMVRGSSKLGRNAFFNSATAALGMATGVIVDAIVVALFGMGWETDAYFIAFTIPIILVTLMRLQATRVVQPLLMRRYEEGGPEEGWRYLNLIASTGFFYGLIVFGIGALCSPLIVRGQALNASPQELSLTNSVSFWLFLVMPLYMPITCMKVALQSFGRFGLPGASKFFDNCFKATSLLLLGHYLGVRALVLGFFVGALWQLVIYYRALRKQGYRFAFIFAPRHKDLREIGQLMIYPTIARLASMGADVLNNTLCSALGAGNVTALRLASRIIDSLAGLLPASIVLAAMPSVSASFISNDIEGVKKHMRRGLMLLVMVTAPTGVLLAMMSRPLIALMYQRRGFTGQDTVLVAALLAIMVPYMFFGRFWGLIELPFFARQDTRTPLFGSILTWVTFAGASFVLVRFMGIYGIPIGRAVACIISPFYLLTILRRQIGSIGFQRVAKPIGGILAATTLMSLCILVGKLMVSRVSSHHFIGKAVILALPSALGLAAYFVGLAAFGLNDVYRLLDKKLPMAARCLDRLGLGRAVGSAPNVSGN